MLREMTGGGRQWGQHQDSRKSWPWTESILAARTKDWVANKQRKFFLSSGGYKSKARVPAGSDGGPLPGLRLCSAASPGRRASLSLSSLLRALTLSLHSHWTESSGAGVLSHWSSQLPSLERRRVNRNSLPAKMEVFSVS